jgi:hypothetical protein
MSSNLSVVEPHHSEVRAIFNRQNPPWMIFPANLARSNQTPSAATLPLGDQDGDKRPMLAVAIWTKVVVVSCSVERRRRPPARSGASGSTGLLSFTGRSAKQCTQWSEAFATEDVDWIVARLKQANREGTYYLQNYRSRILIIGCMIPTSTHGSGTVYK